MSTSADRLDADTPFVPCGPDCECAQIEEQIQADEDKLYELLTIAEAAVKVEGEFEEFTALFEPEELLLVSNVSFEKGIAFGLSLAQDLVDAATAEAVKSTLDLAEYGAPTPTSEDDDELLRFAEELGIDLSLSDISSESVGPVADNDDPQDDDPFYFEDDYPLYDTEADDEGGCDCEDCACKREEEQNAANFDTELGTLTVLTELTNVLSDVADLQNQVIHALRERFEEDDQDFEAIYDALTKVLQNVVKLQGSAEADGLYLEALDARLTKAELHLGLRA